MPLGLSGGYAAGGMNDTLFQLAKQRLLEQELAQRAQEQEYQRLRAEKLDTAAADERTYQHGQDLANRTRQQEVDRLAKEARDQQMALARKTALTGAPEADIIASLGEDQSQTNPLIPTKTPVGIPASAAQSYRLPARPFAANRIDLGNGVKVRPQSMEALDEAASIDKERDIQGQIRVAQAKPVNRSELSGFIGKNGEPIQIDQEGRLYVGTQEVPVDYVHRAPSQSSGGTGPLVQIMGPNGELIWATREEALHQPAQRPISGGDRQTLSYYQRAKDADETAATLDATIAKMGPLQQGYLQYAPNIIQPGANQAYRQAQRAFTEARLRKESGAAINPTEYENDAKTYFAQPGDKPETIALKTQKRKVLLRGLAFAAGRAYDEYYGEPAPRGGEGGGQVDDFTVRVKPRVKK